jgi:radical SAM protein with 4Fe4S-binding SPASM domain
MRLNFESGTACNAKCVFCPRYKMTRVGGEMSDELFHKLIKEGKEMGMKLYSPFMNGEPFLFSRIWQWLDYMQKEEVPVSIYTNAEFMDVDRLIKYKNIKYVNCSLNAATEETYNKVMRGPDFKTVKKKIADLLEKAPFSMRVSMILTDENAHELEMFKEIYGNRTRICGFANWTGSVYSSLERKGERAPCRTIFSQMYVLWDGRVVPCCMDYDGKQIVGDANKQTLSEIWQNAGWIRSKHKRRNFNIPICKSCNYNVRG